MAKKGKKVLEEGHAEAINCDEPHINAARAVLERWVSRVKSTNRNLQDVQQLVKVLSGEIECHQKDLADVRTDASLLGSLRIDELLARRDASTPSFAEKSSSRKKGGAAVRPGSGSNKNRGNSQSSNGGDALAKMAATVVGTAPLTIESAVRQLTDDKKRQRVMNALHTLFRSNARGLASNTSPLAAAAAAAAAAAVANVSSTQGVVTPSTPVSPAAPLSPTIANASTVSPTSPIAVTGTAGPGTPSAQQAGENETTAIPARTSGVRSSSLPTVSSVVTDSKRPREVAPVLWEEMGTLRARRLKLEELLETRSAELATQLARFEMLQESSAVAAYAVEAAQDELKKMMTLYGTQGANRQQIGSGGMAVPPA